MVSTMGTLYGADPSTQAMHLQTALHHDMTLGGALALMIFFAFAMQCTSTMGRSPARNQQLEVARRTCSSSTCSPWAYGAAFVREPRLVTAIFG